MTTIPSPNSPTAQREFVNRIVREVLARLSAGCDSDLAANEADGPDAEGDCQRSAVINDRIVTAKLIRGLSGDPASVRVPPRAIITPSARDEAGRRKIKIECGFSGAGSPSVGSPSVGESVASASGAAASGKSTSPHASNGSGITDAQDPQRAEAVLRQLAFRGIASVGAAVVLSDKPAGEVHRACTAQNQRSVMVASLEDVDRFATDFAPTHWVIDMVRVNLVTAVNIITRIEQQTSMESGK